MKAAKLVSTFRSIYCISVSVILAFLPAPQNVAVAQSAACETTNSALEAMPPVQVTITRRDGTWHRLTAKLADNNKTRAAGFQRVCESIIEQTPILFTFEREVVPSFHMNNVVAPIDIAFIRKSSKGDVIHTMEPYSLMMLKKPLYSSKRPVIAALETHKGFYNKHNIDLGSRITWSEPSFEEHGRDSSDRVNAVDHASKTGESDDAPDISQ